MKILLSILIMSISFVSNAQLILNTTFKINNVVVELELNQSEISGTPSYTICEHLQYSDSIEINELKALKIESVEIDTNRLAFCIVRKDAPQLAFQKKYLINNYFANNEFSDDKYYLTIYNTFYEAAYSIPLYINKFLKVDHNQINDLNIYPNPTSDNLTISFEAEKTDLPISIYSVDGQLMMVQNDARNIGSNEVKIDLNMLPKGMYLMKIGATITKISKL